MVIILDIGNLTKNSKKHGISTEEVEAGFRSGLALPLGLEISPPFNELRLQSMSYWPTCLKKNLSMPTSLTRKVSVLNGKADFNCSDFGNFGSSIGKPA